MRRYLVLVLLLGCGDGGSGAPPPPPPDCVNGGVVCPVGFQCGRYSRSCLNASATMHWRLNDACVDGLGVQARFFDTTNGSVWPGGTNQAWITNVEGGYVDEVLACVPGAKVCYGATPYPPEGHYWGSGIDGDQSCTDCCAICGGGAIQPIDLVCN